MTDTIFSILPKDLQLQILEYLIPQNILMITTTSTRIKEIIRKITDNKCRAERKIISEQDYIGYNEFVIDPTYLKITEMEDYDFEELVEREDEFSFFKSNKFDCIAVAANFVFLTFPENHGIVETCEQLRAFFKKRVVIIITEFRKSSIMAEITPDYIDNFFQNLRYFASFGINTIIPAINYMEINQLSYDFRIQGNQAENKIVSFLLNKKGLYA